MRMKIEIERKYLVKNSSWSPPEDGILLRQAYFSASDLAVVRIRIDDFHSKLCIKSAVSGLSRQEFEYEIPRQDGEKLLELCPYVPLEKIRYIVEYGNHYWEVDEFLGQNKGLIIAEVELGSETELIKLPPWVGKEVSGERRYYNADLYKLPFQEWRNN